MEVVGELAVQAAPGAAWTVRMTSRISDQSGGRRVVTFRTESRSGPACAYRKADTGLPHSAQMVRVVTSQYAAALAIETSCCGAVRGMATVPRQPRTPR